MCLPVRLGNLPDSSLAARKLGSLEYGLFASPAYLARRGVPATPADLASHDRLGFSGGSQSQTWHLHHGAEKVEVATAPRLLVNNSFAVRDAAVQGLGIAQLPLVVAQEQVGQGVLAPVLPQWKRPDVPVHAVFPSARYLTPKVRAFIDLGVEAML